MDDMKEQVNNRMREQSIPYFPKFIAEVKKANDDIAKSKKAPLLDSLI